MSSLEIIMYAGFVLAAYSVVGNDAIQTLGTFLASNQKRPWWVLAIFAGSILTAVLIYGWYINNGDVSYGRLMGDVTFNEQGQLVNEMGTQFDEDGNKLQPKYKSPEDKPDFGWPYLLPPLILLIITRVGIPVSTSFMILTFFNEKNLYDMVVKSMSGYLVAFGAAIILYMIIARSLEKKWSNHDMPAGQYTLWVIAQWCSTGFLWSQWLIQDFANIYVYLPRNVDTTTLIVTLAVFWVMLGYIFYSKGGAIQSIVLNKTNTMDIRSATIIDLTFAMVLLFFKELNNIPMSTTWVFLGILAGREIGIKYFAYKSVPNDTLKDLGRDLAKVFFGLAVSVILVFVVKWLVA
jgi:hypothetical protein